MIPAEIIMNEVVSANAESKFFDLMRGQMFALQIQTTGSLVGTLSIQGANEQDDDVMVELPSGSIAITTADVSLYARAAEFGYVKAYFTYTSGSGTLRIVAVVKD